MKYFLILVVASTYWLCRGYANSIDPTSRLETLSIGHALSIDEVRSTIFPSTYLALPLLWLNK